MNYVKALTTGYPAIQFHTAGDVGDYAALTWDAGPALPSQATLDAWIAANPGYEVVDLGRHVTVLAFRNRFTTAEKVAMEMASLDNPGAPLESRMLAAALRVSMQDSSSASYIDLDRQDTRAGVQQLETYNIIAAGRALIILDSPVTAAEVPPEHVV